MGTFVSMGLSWGQNAPMYFPLLRQIQSLLRKFSKRALPHRTGSADIPDGAVPETTAAPDLIAFLQIFGNVVYRTPRMKYAGAKYDKRKY